MQHPAGTTMLAGGAASFSAGVSNGTGASYQWLRNGAEIAGATQATLTIAQVSLLDTGSVYAVRVTNAAASVTSQGAVLAVTSPPFTVVSGPIKGLGLGVLAAADNTGNMAFAPPLMRVAPNGTFTPLVGSQYGLDSAYGFSFDREKNVLVMLAGRGAAETASCASFQLFCLNPTAFLYEVSANGVVTRREPPLSIPQFVFLLSGTPDGTLYTAGGNRPASLGLTTGGASAVYRIDPGRNLALLAGNPDLQGFADGPFTAALFARINGLAADGQGNVYASDNNRLRRIASNGAVTTIAGNPAVKESVDGQGSAASFKALGSIVLESSGNLLVSDANLIRRVSPDGRVLTLARLPFEVFLYSGLAFDSRGALYVGNESLLGRFETFPQ